MRIKTGFQIQRISGIKKKTTDSHFAGIAKWLFFCPQKDIRLKDVRRISFSRRKDVLLNAALRKDVLRKDFCLKGSKNPGERSLCGFLFRAAAGTAQNAEIFALSGQLEDELLHTRLVEISADLQAESDHT